MILLVKGSSRPHGEAGIRGTPCLAARTAAHLGFRLLLFHLWGMLLLLIIIVPHTHFLGSQDCLNGIGSALTVSAEALTFFVAHHGHQFAANSLGMRFKAG